MELKFWRTREGEEIDFILLTNRRPMPIEVKSGLARLEVPRAIQLFLSGYPAAPGALVLSETLEGQVVCNGKPVLFRPLEHSPEAFSAFN